jgi:glycosyltransferase involved in cell wall biosynthesis
LIVKNEEKYLNRCLNSIAQYVDEIIITDTWSNDSTIEIAKKYTNNIYHYKWQDDFASARNFCQEHATWDYILWLDADEFFEEIYIKLLIKKLKNINKQISFIHIFIRNIVKNNLHSVNRKLKIIKNNQWYKWIWKTHEIVDYYNNDQSKSTTYNDVFFIHNFNPKWKKWYQIESYIELFKNDHNNSNIALDIIKYYLYEKDYNNILNTIDEIWFIHPLFIRKYTELLNIFNNLNLYDEKKSLKNLLKKSLIINDKKYKKEHKLIY